MSVNKSLTLVFLFHGRNQIIDTFNEGIWLVCYRQNQAISLLTQNGAASVIF